MLKFMRIRVNHGDELCSGENTNWLPGQITNAAAQVT